MESKTKKIVVTGGAGFIGSNLIEELNKNGYKNILIVDHMQGIKGERKRNNLANREYADLIEADEFLSLIESENERVKNIDVIFHLGARTDTTEKDKEFLLKNNTEYSKKLYNFSLKNNCQFIYASSAATYGDGKQGYNDKERNLQPLNYYGYSKYLFDEWVLDNQKKTRQWVGLKFFNVYGPNEYHKDFMASVILHGFFEIEKEGKIKLFKSYKKEYPDGYQKRDFIYVKDVVKILLFFFHHERISGIFNVGTGTARTFLDLANALFRAINKKPNIQFIDMPEELKKKYQYFTQADMTSLEMVGYREKFITLEEGVSNYAKSYLQRQKPL